MDVLTGVGFTSDRRLKPFEALRREGNIVLQLDVDDYRKGVVEMQYNVVARLIL